MLAGLLPPEQLARLAPEYVSPGLLALVSEEAPTRTILCAGGGGFEQAHISLTQGIKTDDPDLAAEQLSSRWTELADTTGQLFPRQAWAQSELELKKAGLDLPTSGAAGAGSPAA